MQPKLSLLSLILAALAMAVALSVSVAGSKESLWLDELHTAWVISASPSQVNERAQAGNQTPLYFWALKTLIGPRVEEAANGRAPSTLHQNICQEQLFRMPSTIAWCSSILLLGLIALPKSKQVRDQSTLAATIMLWASVDQIQWFYGTEARPYAWVQLVCLAGWWIVIRIGHDNHQSKDGSSGLKLWSRYLLWSLMASLMIHLHLTAGLIAFAQWTAILVITLRNGVKSALLLSLGSMLAVVVLASPLLYLVGTVWERRVQWSSFASDFSITNLLTMFPLMAAVLPAVAVWSIDRVQFRAKHREHPGISLNTWLWTAAVVTPLMLAWGLTSTGVAPLMHRRFLIGCALPIYCLAGEFLATVSSQRLRYLGAVSVLVSLVWTQGTVDVLRTSQSLQQIRGEDWRSASAWISDSGKSSDLIACSSGLIESQALVPPLSENWEAYLAYPLETIYRPSWLLASNSNPVVGLVSDERLWAEQVKSFFTTDNTQLPSSDRIWLIYRGRRDWMFKRSEALIADLNRSGLSTKVLDDRSFGLVHVRLISVARKTSINEKTPRE